VTVVVVSVKSVSDLCNKQTQALLLFKMFSLSLVHNEFCNVFAFIAMHFLVIFIVCKFAFCFYSSLALNYIR